MALTAKDRIQKPPLAPEAQTDTPTPTPTETTVPTSTATLTPAPTQTSTSTSTPVIPAATATSTATTAATATTVSTATATSVPTETPIPTNTPLPTATSTPAGFPPPPSLAVITYNRLAFGTRPGDLDAFEALPGATAVDKFTAWVDQQLNPGPDNQDTAYWAKRGQHNLYTLGKSLTQLWADHYKNPTNANPRWRPTKDVVIDTLLRAIHSKWQLREVLADFWHNHFNIYAYEGYQEALWPDWNFNVIRKNIFGNFRTFIEDVTKHPSMLYYLDNFINTRSGPNENWARELLELHALGAENYYGPVQRSQIPNLPNGDPRAAGYCDYDVYSAAALCFTGWGVDDDYQKGTGIYQYTDTDHDNLSEKNFLGVHILPNQEPQDDGLIVLDLLAGRPAARVRTDGAIEKQRPPIGPHPGSAKYICRKLARRLIMDNPPQALVEAAAQVFLAEYQSADQLKKVVRFILLWSPTPGGLPLFASMWAEKIKRPFEVTMAMCRAVQADLKLQTYVAASSNNGTPVPAHWDDEDEFFYYYEPMGQAIFEWHPPNGFPDRKEAWKSTTSMLVRWKFAYWLANAGTDTNNDHVTVDYMGQNQGNTAIAITDYWINRILGRPLRDVDRNEIIRFMQGTYGPTSPLPTTEIKNRLKYMVALILSTPDFNFR